jgi:ubiquinone/menaquinone biosynthesis C-methylase UbiE
LRNDYLSEKFQRMSVASHLNITPAQYDAKIRTLIPLYDELIVEAAAALRLTSRKVERVVDLGVGTGALAKACLAVAPRARIWGIDADESMMRMVPTRLGRRRSQAELIHGSFLDADLPPCDAIVASYALHHIKEARAKQRFYRRCYESLRPGGVLINGDCAPAATPAAFARDLEVWFAHLGKTFGRAKGKKVYESWAEEDCYFPLVEETRMLQRAGFTVEVPWRRSPFAVIAAIKGGSE